MDHRDSSILQPLALGLLLSGLSSQLGTGTPSALAEERSCLGSSLRSLQAEHREDRQATLAERKNLDFTDFNEGIEPSSPSVRLDQEIEAGSPSGGRFEISVKPGRNWGSAFGISNDNPHFDTRMFITGTGIESGKLFGFEIKSTQRMTVPGAERMNWAIRQVNHATPAERGHLAILTRFAAADSKQGTEEYLRAWAENATLPIAREWNLLIHDLNVHGLSILIPNEYVLHSQAQTRYLMEFFDFLKGFPGISEDFRGPLAAYFYSDRVRSIDRGTGFFCIAASQGKAENAFNAVFKTLVAQGISPERLIQSIVDSVGTTQSGPKVKTAWEAFRQSRIASPRFASSLEVRAPDEFWSQVKARKRHIEAVARLSRRR